MAFEKTLLTMGLLAGTVVAAGGQTAPTPAGVAEIQGRHDRALVRELGEYLIRNPKADDRDQAYAALFNKAIEHDWFAETEDAAKRYLNDEPDGPVTALAQIISVMARAQAGRFDDALARYKELMGGLGGGGQEEFAVSFTETFAAAAITAGQIDVARKIYQTLGDRFTDSGEVREKASRELARLDHVGKPAPSLDMLDLEGKTVRLASLRGKYVLVDFWATWCAPCIADLPRLQDAYRKYHDAGLEIVAVSLDETRSAVVDFVKVRKLPWLQFHNASAGADLVDAFGVNSIPANYLIDPEGKIIRLDLRGSTLDAVLAKLIPKAR